MRLIVCLLLLVGSSLTVSAQQTAQTIQVNGITRNYLRYFPVNYQASENLPVVFVLHGLGSNAQQMSQAGFNQVADTARIIIIYPDGKNNGFGQASWNNDTGAASNADDLGFFNKLIDKMILDHNADSTSIYFSGFSMGGIMSHHLACALNHRIAAIGSMAGTMPTSDIQNCQPSYKTPVIHLHGTSDGVVPYDSNPLPTLSLVPETMAFWRNVHGCVSAADSIRLPDTANDNITVDRFIYQSCNPNGSVELWRLNGADHIYLYEPANDITEGKEIWRFFRKWHHPSPATVSVSSLESNKKHSIFPNPSKGKIIISSTSKSTGIVRDLSGKQVARLDMKTGDNEFDMDLPSGIYFFTIQGITQKIIIDKNAQK
jgi:polyhydroxybutyrate depolymerase